MTDYYARLVQLTVEHEYFRSGVVETVRVRPATETQRALRAADLLVRRIGPVWLLGAEVDPVVPSPGADPEVHLRRPLPANVLRFGLVVASPVVPLVSTLDAWQPGATVYHLSNLTPSGAADAPYLTDPATGERLGPPVPLVAGPTWTYPLATPAAAVELTVADLFGSTIATLRRTFDEPVDGVALDLASIEGLTTGRYTIQDDTGGTATLYYAPGMEGEPLFAMVELYVSSLPFADPPEQVVGDYRFLDGERVLGAGPFRCAIPARTTYWQYVLEKKYADNGIPLDRVEVTGDLDFDRTALSASQATFESNDPAVWHEAPLRITLEDHRGRPLQQLPVPGPGTALRDREAGGQSAVQFIYL